MVFPQFLVLLVISFAVSAILNTYDEFDFAEASGPLLVEGIETHHLKNQEAVATVCRRVVLR